jgi:ABC-2 type transport system ATP-binding protein
LTHAWPTGNVSPAPLVAARDLSKRWGAHRAVDGVSLEVFDHEVMGLLGPNGSGKSTILRILAGYLRPSAGSASIAGHDVVHDSLQARRLIGYVPEDVSLYPQMRVAEFLVFMARLRGLAGSALGQALDAAIMRLSLQTVTGTLIGRLSRGYRQRVAIAQALVGSPRLLLLDEPTNGLDPRQIIELRELIGRLSGDVAILVSSHVLGEIERVADRVAILLHGRLLGVTPIAAIPRGGLEQHFLALTDPSSPRA